MMDYQDISMTSDVLAAHYVASLSAEMLLTMYDQQALNFLEVEFYLFVPSQCWEIAKTFIFRK